jgi:molecular chaperone DnaK
VTFDIDANGILNVTARDQETGKEQTVTISESTNLSKSEVESMVQDAQAHAADDKGRHETIEARNQADSLAYQMERTLKDLGDKIPMHEKARAEHLIEETRGAVKDETVGKERYQQLASDLQQALQMSASAAYQQAGKTEDKSSRAGSAQPGGGDDVVDAEFTER